MEEIKIVCHVSDEFAKRFSPQKWEVRQATGTYGANLRHCSYCGSIHPEDLLKVLSQGAALELSDFKHGWPHKFYVKDILNPLADEIVEIGSESKRVEGKIVSTPIMGTASKTIMMKWYNIHLLDIANSKELFDNLTNKIKEMTGIQFLMTEKGLAWKIK